MTYDPAPTPPPRAPVPAQPMVPAWVPPPQQPQAPYGSRGWAGYGSAPSYVLRPDARPGLLTSIAIVSIVVASISLLGSLISGSWGLSIMRIARTTSATAAS